MEKIKLVLVDDHQVVRDGIRMLLEDNPKYEIVGMASTGEEAVDTALAKKPDVVLMDISLSGINGIEATKQILAQDDKIKVMALSMIKEGQYIRQMLQVGASGYLLKNSGKEELFKAIDTIAFGDSYFSQEVYQTVMNYLVKPKKEGSNSLLVNLTHREKEILELIIKEYSNGEIAEKLFISSRTVEAHKRKMIEKAGAKNLSGLIAFAIKNNLVDY